MRTGELETPVFHGGRRRASWLRVAGIVGCALVVLWLAALVAGVMGFGGLGELSLPALGGSSTPVLHRAPARAAPAIGRSATRSSGAASSARSRRVSDGRAASPSSGASRSGRTPLDPTGRRSPAPATHPGVRRPGRSSTGTGALTGTALTPATTTHGRRLGTTGTSSPSSSSHRGQAPGQLDTTPAPQSPNARANRTTTTTG